MGKALGNEIRRLGVLLFCLKIHKHYKYCEWLFLSRINILLNLCEKLRRSLT